MASVQGRRESADETQAGGTDKAGREENTPGARSVAGADAERKEQARSEGGTRETKVDEGSQQAIGAGEARKPVGGEREEGERTGDKKSGGGVGSGGHGGGEQDAMVAEAEAGGKAEVVEKRAEGGEAREGGEQAVKAEGGGGTESEGGSGGGKQVKGEEGGDEGGGVGVQGVQGAVLPPTHVPAPSSSAYCASRIASGTELTPALPTPPLQSSPSSSLYPLAAATNPFAFPLPAKAPTTPPPATAPPASIPAVPPQGMPAAAAAGHPIPPGGPHMRLAGGMARTAPSPSVLPVQPNIGMLGGVAGGHSHAHAQAEVEEAARVTPHSSPEEELGPAPMDVDQGKRA